MSDDGAVLTEAQQRSLWNLLVLLELYREARLAQTVETLRFVMLNQTRRLVVYGQAGFLRLAPSGRATLEAVSNIGVLDRDAPFVHWLEGAGTAVARSADARRPHVVDPAALPPEARREWGEWGAAQVLWCPLVTADGTLAAALWLARNDVWSEDELVLLEQLAEGYAHALCALTGPRPGGKGRHWRAGAAAAVVMAGALAMPVPQSVLAPAEVAAHEPLIVTAPLDGVIERFHVQPNEPVVVGQPLFSFEQTVLRSRVEVAHKVLTAAEAEHLTAVQGAFADPQSKTRLAQLKAQVDLRRAELDLARELLERVTVRAERTGIAVLADVNDWLGKPVTVGERIMTLADPAAAEIIVRVPAGDALTLEAGARVSVFLNVDPLRPVRARLVHASYEPKPTPAGVLAFQVRAALEPDQPTPRIGLRGTARIEGPPVSLAFFLFRRPLAMLRQTVGF